MLRDRPALATPARCGETDPNDRRLHERQSYLTDQDWMRTSTLDPDAVLREKITEFVERGDFGLASGEQGQGNFTRVWYRETPAQDEVTFDSSTFLITRERAEQAKAPPEAPKPPAVEPEPWQSERPAPAPEPAPAPPEGQPPMPMPLPQKAILRLKGTVPPESWNMMGIRILTKLQSGVRLNLAVDLSVEVDPEALPSLRADILQALADLKLDDQAGESAQPDHRPGLLARLQDRSRRDPA